MISGLYYTLFPDNDQKRLKKKIVKDSWVRRLRLAEAKRIRRISIQLVVTIGGIILLGGFSGIYFDILDDLSIPLVIGISTAALFWALVSYGDHKLRKIRIQRGWYGSDVMEVYELIQFIKKTAEDDSNNSNPPRRFFEDDELIAGTEANDRVTVTDSLRVR